MAKFGPGILVTAAFIGPGTIATASAAGAQFGFALLWALLFSIAATIILQEMAARAALATGNGLAETLRNMFASRAASWLVVVLVVAAVGIGNAAYEAGNISGAALALSSTSPVPGGVWAVVIGLAAGGLLFTGHYRLLERVLIALVLVMSLVFLLCAALVAPSPAEMLDAVAKPSLPPGSTLTAIALIGTTVVPYNLFLHANAVREKWGGSDIHTALSESRWDTGLSIGLGGLITLAIMSTAAAAFFQTGNSFDAERLADQLEPLLGPAAHYVFALGLFAGGITSAITAPMAAGYAVCGAMGWSRDLRSSAFRAVCAVVLLSGTLFSALGTKPLAAILFAQATNGFLLPIVAILLLILMNRASLLGALRNGWMMNTLGIVVVAVAIGLGGVKLGSVLGLI